MERWTVSSFRAPIGSLPHCTAPLYYPKKSTHQSFKSAARREDLQLTEAACRLVQFNTVGKVHATPSAASCRFIG